MELTAQAAEQENEQQRQADAAAKKLFAERVEKARAQFIERQIKASERATVRALELLETPIGGEHAARLLETALKIGASVMGLQGATIDGSQPSATASASVKVMDVHVTRDGLSDRASRVYHDFFKANPEWPQAQRYIAEHEDLERELGHEVSDALPASLTSEE